MNENKREARRVSAYIVCLLLMLVWAFIQPGRAQAQWTTSGNDISNTNTGNVGVGTAAPLAKFQIVTPTQDDSPVTAWDNRFFIVGSGDRVTGAISLSYNQSTKTGYLMSLSPYSSWNNTVINPFAGNVGIGTTSPVSSLDVQLSFTNYLNLRGPSGTGAWVRVVPQSTGSKVWKMGANEYGYSILDEAAIEYRLVVGNNGNVGIGTTNPTAKFYVQSSNNNTTADIGQFFANNLSQGIGIGYNRIEAVGSNTNQDVLVLPKGTGKVQIGVPTQNPSEVLTVNGDVNVTGNINAKYQDVAEWVRSRQQLAAGTVVILDPEKPNQVIASAESYDTRVAGVISEQPGVLLGEGGEGKVKVATTGRVRVKVDASRGPIRIGDLLVTSEREGVAMKSEPVIIQGKRIHAPGTIIGKALEPLASGTGEILVLLSLQ